MVEGDPCGWAVNKCGCGTCWTSHSPATRTRAAALAIGLMWAATGRRYGVCEVTVQPCNPRPNPALYQDFTATGYDMWAGPGGQARPVLDSGAWSNQCGSGCSCKAACEVELPGPVAGIVAVTAWGVSVPLSAVEVHDGHLLVRVDGDCWPNCQRPGLELPDFEVTYLRGWRVPANVQGAVEALACQYATACTGGTCALPQRLSSLSRQGVSLTVAAVDAEGGQIRTGLQLVDDVIRADNPLGLGQTPMVLSPDWPPPVRTVTWMGGS